MGVAVGQDTTVSQESFEDRARQLVQLKRETEKEMVKEQERAKKSPFNNFYQVNTKNNRFLTELATKQPKALAILLFIFENMDGFNALMASYKVFEEQFSISQSTVKRCIGYLKDHGYIHIYKSGTSNVYVVNNELVWKSYGTNIKHCKFPANIILSSEEQEQKNNGLKKQRVTVIDTDGDGDEK